MSSSVRSLLRAEKASRLPPKVTPNPKKRKAEDDSPPTPTIDDRKRTKPSPPLHGDLAEQFVPAQESTPPVETPTAQAPPPPIPQPAEPEVDDAEWAAFERDVATPPPSIQPSKATYTSHATISALPVTAAELEAQRRTDAKQERDRRFEDEVAEKEEAAERMADEFEEMEKFEDRIRSLRERREALRAQVGTTNGAEEEEDGDEVDGEADKYNERLGRGVDEEGYSEEDGSDLDSEEDDEWKFGRR